MIALVLTIAFNYRAHIYKLEQTMFENYKTLIIFSKLISLNLEIVISAK